MSVRFEVPDDVRFTCTRCGDCCRNVNILLTGDEVTALDSLDWRGREDRLAGVEATVRTGRSRSGRRRLVQRDDGACIFLGDAQQCLLHEHFGPRSKPLMCRLYPFNFYPLGKRTAVDCAFSCRSVSAARGEPLAKQFTTWQEQLVELGLPGTHLHRLNDRHTLTDDLLWEMEQHLLTLLAAPDLSLFDRLRCMLQYARLATTGDPNGPSAAQLRSALVVGLPRQIEKTPARGGWNRAQRALFFQWLYLALNPATANQDLLNGRELQQEEKRRIAAGNRYRVGGSAPFVDNRELATTFDEISEIDASYVEGEGAVRLESFLRAKIVGQRFLLAGDAESPFVEALPKLLLVYPMALWAAQALAADRSSPRVEEEDLRQAIRLLDRSLGQLTTSRLPKRQAKASNYIMVETDFVVRSRNELLGRDTEEGDDEGFEDPLAGT